MFRFFKKDCKPGKHKFKLLWKETKQKTLVNRNENHFGTWKHYACKRCGYKTEVKVI